MTRTRSVPETPEEAAPKTKQIRAEAGAADVAGCLLDCVVMQSELFDEFVEFLPPSDLAHTCDVLALSRAARSILFETQRWTRLIQEHCGVDVSADKPLQVQRTIEIHAGCEALADYVNLRGQVKTFRDRVLAVVGDMNQIERIGDQAIDCFVFPTSGTYRDPGIGVSGRIHARAGRELDQWIACNPPYTRQGFRSARSGSVLVTPGFGTRAQLLVHCVGPYHDMTHNDQLLYTTYVNALIAIEQSDTLIQCAAIASISTGAMGFPVNTAARIAMRAIRDVIRTRKWTATLAFVCFDQRTHNEFASAKDEVLSDFHIAPLEYPQALSGQYSASVASSVGSDDDDDDEMDDDDDDDDGDDNQSDAD